MVDDKMSKNIMNDLRKHLPPGGFPSNQYTFIYIFKELLIEYKPVVTSKLGKPVHCIIKCFFNQDIFSWVKKVYPSWLR